MVSFEFLLNNAIPVPGQKRLFVSEPRASVALLASYLLIAPEQQ